MAVGLALWPAACAGGGGHAGGDPLAESQARAAVERLLPAVREAAVAVAGIDWPAVGAAEWPKVKDALTGATAALAAYRAGVAATPEAAKESPESKAVAGLAAAAADLRRAVTGDAGRRLQAFDVFADADFFALYPVTLEAAFLEANWAALRPRLRAASPAALAAFGRVHASRLSDARRRQLGSLYRQKAEAAGDGVLRAIVGAAAAGFTAPRASAGKSGGAPALRIAFVDATSPALLRDAQVDFAPQVALDLPFETAKTGLADALKPGAWDLVIVFNTALAKAERWVRELKDKRSSRLVKAGRMANPELGILRAKIDFLARRNQDAKDSNKFWFGFPIGDSDVEAEMERAERQYMGLPRMVDDMVEEAYDFDVTRVEGRKTLSVAYHVIDPKSGRAFRDFLDITERRDFRVAYRINSADPKRAMHLGSYDQESDVKDWERLPVQVSLAALMGHYLDNRTDAKPYADAATLMGEINDQRNRARLAARPKVRDRLARDDPRFESVVAIFLGRGGMATGFYVAPDVVLTNWHVVDKSTYVEMERFDGTETFGRVMVSDVRLDLALVKVQRRGPPVRIRRAPKLATGQTIEIIGHPRRLLFSLTQGVISTVREVRSRGGGKKVLYVQTDTPTSPGSSGSPLFLGDEVIGIHSAGIPMEDGLGFAIHYAEVLSFLAEHLEQYKNAKIERIAG